MQVEDDGAIGTLETEHRGSSLLSPREEWIWFMESFDTKGGNCAESKRMGRA